MALINTGTDSWLLEYNACEVLSRDIMEQLSSRDKEKFNSIGYNSLSGKIRVRLKQYQNEVSQLGNKLNVASVVSSLTDEEKERRLRQVEQLQSRLMQAEKMFGSSSGSKTVAVEIKTSGWGDDDDEDDSPIHTSQAASSSDFRANNARILREQEEGLEGLSQIIGRQKRIATAISGEVDDQNEILDDIANNMDRVDNRVQSENAMIKTLLRKDSTWVYWVVIILLFIIILSVSFA